MTIATEEFANSLPIAANFEGALDPEMFRPVPSDWFLAMTDVAASRLAIAEGREKQVNMVGAALIAAMMNGLKIRSLPYTFSGDGAAVALSPAEAERMRPDLAALITWARIEHGLELRAALIPVSELRATGNEVSIAAVRVSGDVVNYAFFGGGLGKADQLLKAGAHAIPTGPENARPDLAGLSCRWAPVRPEHEKVVSLIVEPAGDGADFPMAARRVLDELKRADAANGPFGAKGPQIDRFGAGMAMEIRNSEVGTSARAKAFVRLLVENVIAWVLLTSGVRAFGFDPVQYRQTTANNTDYRKMQDGLRMTLVLSSEEQAGLLQLLTAEESGGRLHFGLCEQDAAILTCYVPTVARDDHLHFLDGAGGGYSAAASDLEIRRRNRHPQMTLSDPTASRKARPARSPG